MKVGDHDLTHNLCENVCASARHRKLRGSHQNRTIKKDQNNHNGYKTEIYIYIYIARDDESYYYLI